MELTWSHVTEKEFWSQDWISAGTREAVIAQGRNQAPDEPKTMGGQTAAGFEQGGREDFTALFKYTCTKVFREIVHMSSMQEYKSSAGILPA